MFKVKEGEDFNRPREIWLRISQGKQEYIEIFRGLKSEPDTEIGQKGHLWMDTIYITEEDRMIEIGVIHGRFQVLHNDHLKYLLAGKQRCRHMVVGITNPDPVLTSDNSADLQRSNPIANPLTYFERYTMIRRVLMDTGVSDSDFSVVPLPINKPELFKYYVPLDATFFLTIYDEWGRQKLKQFQVMGLATEVLWERPLNEKGISGNDVRKRMATGNKWEHLVPESTRTLMIKWDIPDRIKRLHKL